MMEYSSCHSSTQNRKLIYQKQSNLICTRSQGNSAVCNSDNNRKRSSDNDTFALPSTNKRKRTIQDMGDGKLVESDAFCWICHCEGSGVSCDLCPRFYHIKCLTKTPPPNQWICPECQKVMTAEAVETESELLKLISIDTLCILLRYVLQRMKLPETKPFHQPVDCANLPTYTDFIFHPMDFATIDRNIKRQVYGSTEAFIADVKWILHNCIIFNGKNHPLTSVAKSMFKICCHETTELQICPDCYLNSCVKENDDWFCEPCRKPHSLVWAKMKGYPFWPAKVLREENSQVDVRFFGEHDRAWVTLGQVFLLSENPPGSVPKKTKGFDIAKAELNRHLELLRHKFGNFSYAPDKTLYKSSMILNHEFAEDASSSQISSTPSKISNISNKLLMKRKLSHSQPKHFSLKRNFVRASEVKERRTSKRRQSQLNFGDNIEDNGKVCDDSKKIVLKINKVHLLHNSKYKESEEMETSDEINKTFDKDELEDSCEAMQGKYVNHEEANLDDDVDEQANGIVKFNDNINDKVANTIVASENNNITGDGSKNNILDTQSINYKNNKPLQTNKQSSHEGCYYAPNNEILKISEKQNSKGEQLKSAENENGTQTFLKDVEINEKICENEVDLDESFKSQFDVIENINSSSEKSCTSIAPLPSTLSHESQICNPDVITEDNENGRCPESLSLSQVGRSTSSAVEDCLNESEVFKKFKLENTDIDMKKYVNKMFSSIKDVLSEIVEDLLNSDNPNVLHNFLVEELKKIKESHNAELDAVKHSSALQIAEMRLLHQFEKKKFECMQAKEILNLKTTLWCANCMKEALYNCCWKANYCSPQCQRDHWPKHMELCANYQDFANHLDPPVSTFYSPKKPVGIEQKVKLRLQNPVRPIRLADGNKNVSTIQHVGIPSVVTSLPSYLLQHSLPLQGSQQRVLPQQHLQQFVIQGSNACGYVSPIKPCVIAPLQKMPPS